MRILFKGIWKSAKITLAALCLLFSGMAMAAFVNDEALTYGGNPLDGSSFNQRMAWNSVTSKMGMVYVDSFGSGNFAYVEWTPGSGITSKTDTGVSGTAVLGLSFDASGLPHAGVIGGGNSNYMELVKQSGGSWIATDTGKAPSNVYLQASYELNPSTGTGAFFGNMGATPISTYIYYSGGSWQTANCGTNGGFAETSMAFTSAGVPYVVFGDDVATTKVAGKATPGSQILSTITNTGVYAYCSQQKIAIDPTNGDVWVAYIDADWHLYVRKWTGTAWGAAQAVDISNTMTGGGYAQLGFAISPSHDLAIMYPMWDAQTESNAITLAYYDHLTSAWTLETLNVPGAEITGLDLVYSGDTLRGLYHTGTAPTQFHILSTYNKPPPVYMKVTMNDQTGYCVIHLKGQYANKSFTNDFNLWNDGMFDCSDPQYGYATSYPTYTDRMLTGNQSTPYVDLAPLNLSSYRDNIVLLYAMQEWGVGTSPANFTVKLSTTPSDTGVFKTFTRSGTGMGLSFVIDKTQLANTLDDAGWSTNYWNTANALPAVPGIKPSVFPVMTGNALAGSIWGTQVYQQSSMTNEQNTMSKLGINGPFIDQSYVDNWYNNGFAHIAWDSKYLPTDFSDFESEKAGIQSMLDASIASAQATGHTANIDRWALMDEGGSNSMAHIGGCSVCATQFRIYLQKKGFTPQDFGQTAWSAVSPYILKTGTATQKKLYYLTGMFRCQIYSDAYKWGTDYIHATLPNALTCPNWSDSITFSGMWTDSGIDPFNVFETGGYTMAVSENWLANAVSRQLTGYEVDHLRSAIGSYMSGKVGMYICDNSCPWDTQAETISAIAHGAQQIYHYSWGPYYTQSSDKYSFDTVWWAGMQNVNYLIGNAEWNLLGATVPQSKVALLYSQASDIWKMADDPNTTSEIGKDNNGLYLLLRHLGYSVDILTEKDVAAGKLASGGYKMLFCNAQNMLNTALVPLENWINAGGVLYMGPGSLTYNESGASLGFDTWAGISRKAYVFSVQPGYETLNFQNLTNLMPVTYSGNSLEALCGYQKMNSTPAGATVLATFADATAAAWRKTMGSGRIEWSGFFPGLGYEKGGVVTLLARAPGCPTKGSTDYPAAYRTFVTDLLSPVTYTDRVTTNNYLVEASRLEAPSSSPCVSMILLTNWTGYSVNGLQVAIPQNGRMGTATSFLNTITNQTVASGVRTVTLDMAGPIDIIQVDPSGTAPTVSITAPTAGTTIGSSYNITATASDSDGSITKVDFYQGQTLLGTDSSSPYAYSWTSVPGGDYTLTAVATDSSGNTVTSDPVAVTLWNTADIGTVGQAGSASYNAGTFTVAGAGAGITGTADAFRFVYQQATENCTITARVATWTDSTQAQNRAGVMMRATTAANSIEASSLFYSSASAKRVYFHRRTTAGGSTTTSNVTAAAAPQWVRVSRVGNTIKTYKSVDGLNWTYVSATAGVTVTMTNPIQIGLAVTSGTTASTKTATFDNVRITRP